VEDSTRSRLPLPPLRTSPRMLSNFARDTAAPTNKTSIVAADDELVAVSVERDDAVSVLVHNEILRR